MGLNFAENFLSGAKILDTCAQPNYALNMSLEFVKDLIELDVSSNFYCSGDEPAKRRFPHKPLVGVIGASYSSVSTMVANLLR